MASHVPVLPDTLYLLIQDHGGIKRRLYTSEEAARKTAALPPSYWYPPRKKNQGGDLYMLRNGYSWLLVESIDGDYNLKKRGVYK